MKLLGNYINGDINKSGAYKVSLFSDGTRVKETLDKNATEFISTFPDSFDCKITSFCSRNCSFCHEDSSINGKHGDILNAKFINSLKPYTEVALGGGEVTSHPDLLKFLQKLKDKNIIANLTVSQEEFMEKIDLLYHLSNKRLIYGLGVSYRNDSIKDNRIIKYFQSFPNLVIHVINGIVNKRSLMTLANKDLKVLILGYKMIRRGKDFYNESVKINQDFLYKDIRSIISKKMFDVVSFDNLALEQLKVKRLLSDEEWKIFFQGSDGQSTLYVSVPENKFASSSLSMNRYDLLDNIEDMLKIVQKERK